MSGRLRYRNHARPTPSKSSQNGAVMKPCSAIAVAPWKCAASSFIAGCFAASTKIAPPK